MADTAIAITAGTGTNVDTRTEATNGNHRQVIVIGDPSTNAGVAPVDATTGLAVNVTNASLTVASHAVTNAGTFAVQAAATLAAETTKVIGTVNIAAAQTLATVTTVGAVTAISNALPAGTNAIGKLAANSGVDIGDVDVTTIGGQTPAYGSGAIAANVPRMALATDSPGVIPTVTSDQASNYAAPAMRLVPGETHVGETGGKTVVASVTLSTDTSAYASGDLIADTQQIDAFFRKVDGTGIINSINIIDEDAQGVALYIIFMSTTTSLGTENSAPNISDANLTAGFQGIVSVATSDYVTVSGTKIATIRNIGLPVKAVSGTDDLYIAVLNATGTPTFTAAGLEMRIGGLLD